MGKRESRNKSKLPARYVLAFLAHLGFSMAYCMRVNLSIAIVAMTNSTLSDARSTAKTDPECPRSDANVTSKELNGEFNWDQKTQGLILSSFFYGYLVTQLPGAFLASRFGGKWVFGIGVLVTAIFTLCTPVAAKAGASYVILMRVLEGLGEGVTFPAIHAMMARWSPPFDKTRLVSIAFSGVCSGTIIGYPVSGLLCKYGFAGGWPSVFYVFGLAGVIWFVFWIILVYNSPEEHPWISSQELKYILQSTADSVSYVKKRSSVPWLAMFKSLPFWALVTVQFSSNWVLYVIITGLPSYLSDVLGFNIQSNGWASALPFVFGFMAQLFAGFMSDHLISRGILSVTATRKLATVLGTMIPASVLISITYLGCADTVLAMVLMTCGVGLGGLTTAGYSVNHLDISPNFASVLMGITNSGGTIAGCLAPLITGYFTQNEPTRGQWQKVIFLSAGINYLGGLVFLLFASGKQQPWNVVPESVTNNCEENGVRRLSVNSLGSTEPLLPKYDG